MAAHSISIFTRKETGNGIRDETTHLLSATFVRTVKVPGRYGDGRGARWIGIDCESASNVDPGDTFEINKLTRRSASNPDADSQTALPGWEEARKPIAQVPDRSDGFPFRTPDVHLLNLRVGIQPDDDWELVACVENLTGEAYFTGAGKNFGYSGFRLRPHPRIWGTKVNYRFAGAR